jgi:hypothetical protein
MEHHSSTTENAVVFRISWVAYVVTLVGLFFVTLVAASFINFISSTFAHIAIAAGIVFIAYRIAMLRSFRLYSDEHGVWIYRGILPWNKGVSGVKWRDLEDAAYTTSFFSWVFKAYTVRIGHRFTKTSEVVVPYLHKGHEAVIHINDQHRLIMGNS